MRSISRHSIGVKISANMPGGEEHNRALLDRYRALNPAIVDQALRRTINPNAFTFVVVGDAAKVRPQLAKLGLPIEEMQPR